MNTTTPDQKSGEVTCTGFPHGRATEGTLYSGSLHDLALLVTREFPDKLSQPLLKFGVFEGNTRRAGAKLIEHTGLALDFDNPTLSASDALQKLGGKYRALVYETWSGGGRYRVVVPLAKPLPPDADLHHAAQPIIDLIGEPAPESFDPLRCSFIGCPQGEKRGVAESFGDKLEASYKPRAPISAKVISIHGGVIAEGARNTTLHHMLAGLRRRDACTEPMLLAAGLALNSTFQPPMEEREVAAIVRSVLGYEPGSLPREISVPSGPEFERALKRERRDLIGDKLPVEFSDRELQAMNVPETKWFVEGLIAPGVTLLVAPPKTGKSYFALQLCMCVAAGIPFLGCRTARVPTAYFDLEEWHALLKERVQAIRKGNAIPPGIACTFCLEIGMGEQALADMARMIANGAKLIVVDVLARIRDELNEDAKKNAYARDYAAIKKLADFALANPGIAIVIVHHANKGTKHEEWQAKISGSYGLSGASHTNCYLAPIDTRGMNEEDKEQARRYRTLYAAGKEVEQKEFAIEMMLEGGGWQLAALKPWEIKVTRLQKELLMLMHTRPDAWWTARELAEAMGGRLAATQELLRRMAKQGAIESAGQGGAGYRVKSLQRK